MSKITICRTNIALPDVMDNIRTLLFGCLDGQSRDDKRRWNRFWRRVLKLEPGELINVDMVFPRNPLFHRKYFALLNLGFEAWIPDRTHKTYKGMPVLKNFEQFREDITILAGYYDQVFNLKGEMKIRAQSISFANMDDDEFEGVYNATIDVLLAHVFENYKDRHEVDRVVQEILGFI